MKIAISLPDPVFEAAEAVARRLNKSRSQLYAEAVADYVGRHDELAIREKLDAIYAVEPSQINAGFEAAQAEALTPNDEAW